MVRSVANDVSELSSKLKLQVTDVTNFTTQSTERFNEILLNMKNQFDGFENTTHS